MRSPEVVGVVSKAQALDKLLAITAEFRAESPETLTTAIVPTRVLASIESTPTTLRLLESATEKVISIDPFDCDPQQILLESKHHPSAKRTVLVPFSKDETNLSGRFSQAGRSLGMQVIGFFKSLHDEGYGLTSEDRLTASAIMRRLAASSRLPLRPSAHSRAAGATDSPRLADFDLFVAFNRSHARLLAMKGIPKKRIVVGGYPLDSDIWVKSVTAASGLDSARSEGPLRIAFFPRGETPGRPSSENVVPHDDLRRYISWLASALGRNPTAQQQGYILNVKPHPIQSRETLARLLSDYFPMGFRITDEIPSVVVAGADVAISTYSSTLVDALLFGVPSIEVLVENDWFRRKHPTGSPFIEMGASRASSVDQVERLLEEALTRRESTDIRSLNTRACLVQALNTHARSQ